MKKIIFVCSIALFTACGGGLDGKKLADEVCDCSKKANAMDASDPKRAEAQNDCMKKNAEAWNKVKDDTKQSAAFNKASGDCASEQIKKSFGQ